MQRSMFRVRGSFWQFVREHISEPFWGIYNELVHNQPLTLTDANALADSSNRYIVAIFHSRHTTCSLACSLAAGLRCVERSRHGFKHEACPRHRYDLLDLEPHRYTRQHRRLDIIPGSRDRRAYRNCCVLHRPWSIDNNISCLYPRFPCIGVFI